MNDEDKSLRYDKGKPRYLDISKEQRDWMLEVNEKLKQLHYDRSLDYSKIEQLIPPAVLAYLVVAMAGGARKYGLNNWQKSISTPDHSYFIDDRLNSLERHLMARHSGDINDIEMEVPHTALMMTNALMIMMYDNASEEPCLD